MNFEGPVLWGACSVSAGVAVFFVKIWIGRLAKDIEKMEAELAKKLDAILCDERHTRVESTCDKLFRHRHANTGEVILP